MVFYLKYAVLMFSCYFAGFVSYPANEHDNGNPCGDGNTNGVCKIVTECPLAYSALMQGKNHGLERCGWEKVFEIVCCPDGGGKPPPDRGGDGTLVWPEVQTKPPKKPETRNPGGTRKSELACRAFMEQISPMPTLQILGGENSTLGEFPHMVSLGYDGEGGAISWECGGTLISNIYVITAAHCVVKQDGTTPIIARMGIVDLLGRDEAKPQDYKIVNITVHEQYQRRSKLHDLALVRLDGEVPTTDYVYPACLYQTNDNPIGLVITGWGYTKSGGDPSVILQKADLHAVDEKECSSIYQSRLQRTIISSQICAVSNDGKKDTCQGDSGGPLQVQNRKASSIYSIVGITSFGMGCGGKAPGVYTRVYSYLDWIENIVWR